LSIRTDSRPQNIKEGIEGKPVSWYSEVFATVFSDLDRTRTNSLWKKELAKSTRSRGKKSTEQDPTEREVDEKEFEEDEETDSR
jgi:ATP-dependent Lon protease